MREWLDTVAGVKVERMPLPYLSAPIDFAQPRKGVLHTTEGSWASAMSVFRNHYAPNFMVGRDDGRVRVAQFAPLGRMGQSLEHVTAPETNRWAIAQIELVGYSQKDGDPLGADRKPLDDELRAVLAALMLELVTTAGIPLVHAGNGTRSIPNWKNKAGWFGHSEVPGQPHGHWDPGNIDWDKLFSAAKREPTRPLVVYQLADDNEVLAESKPVRAGRRRERWRLRRFLNARGRVATIVDHLRAEQPRGSVQIRRVEKR